MPTDSVISSSVEGGISMKNRLKSDIFPSASEDARSADCCAPSPQTLSSSYRLAYRDSDFLLRDELRSVRLQLELLKPELILQEHNIENTIIIFGGSRIPEPETAKEQLEKAEEEARKDPSNKRVARRVQVMRAIAKNSCYYEEARRLGFLISQSAKTSTVFNAVVITGGGPGIMEAANRGAHDAGAKSIGLNVVIPFEQRPNRYITPELCFQFHYFAIRKMHFLIRARALVVFPGGFGTLDELFETLTLIQTAKIKPIPVLIFGREFWNKFINFETLVEEGFVSPQDIELFQFVETAEEAHGIIVQTTT